MKTLIRNKMKYLITVLLAGLLICFVDPYEDNGQLSYSYKDGTWSAVSETVDASSLFSYANKTLTLTLATGKSIANIGITKGVTQ